MKNKNKVLFGILSASGALMISLPSFASLLQNGVCDSSPVSLVAYHDSNSSYETDPSASSWAPSFDPATLNGSSYILDLTATPVTIPMNSITSNPIPVVNSPDTICDLSVWSENTQSDRIISRAIHLSNLRFLNAPGELIPLRISAYAVDDSTVTWLECTMPPMSISDLLKAIPMLKPSYKVLDQNQCFSPAPVING